MSNMTIKERLIFGQKVVSNFQYFAAVYRGQPIAHLEELLHAHGMFKEYGGKVCAIHAIHSASFLRDGQFLVCEVRSDNKPNRVFVYCNEDEFLSRWSIEDETKGI